MIGFVLLQSDVRDSQFKVKCQKEDFEGFINLNEL